MQYTWSVPQDLAALASLMGGDAAASSKLTTFFSSLNATRDAPYDWSGNEPSEWAPWEFDYFGAPEQTQGTVRAIVDDRVRRRPGRRTRERRPRGHLLVVRLGGPRPVPRDAGHRQPRAGQSPVPVRDHHAARRPPPRRAGPGSGGLPALRPRPVRPRSGTTRTRSEPPAVARPRLPAPLPLAHWDRPWLPPSVLRSGATLSYTLSSSPDPTWASAPAASPPSFTQGELPAVGFSRPGGSISLAAGQATAVQIGVASAGGSPTPVRWQVMNEPVGLQVSPTSGTLTLGSANTHPASSTVCGPPVPATEAFTITGATPGASVLRVDLTTTGGVALPPVVLDVVIGP